MSTGDGDARSNQYLGVIREGRSWRAEVVLADQPGQRGCVVTLRELHRCDHRHRSRSGALYCAVALAEERAR